MLRMARRDMMASVTAFLNCLKRQVNECRKTDGRDQSGTVTVQGWTHLIARYMGLMAKSGKVCTLIIMVMKAMYSRTLMKPGGGGDRAQLATRAAGTGDAGADQKRPRLPSPVNSSV